ncbi:MAG: hypothetical protein COC01_09845 [Bacteroidetes bacterium]|nr:MAG: hypothetical protein COC01_09845 [Bacteroidota bacterium]
MRLSTIIILILVTSKVFPQCNDWEWAKSATGLSSNTESMSAITLDDAENIYGTGYFYSDTISFDSLKLYSSGFNDIFISKHNKNGDAVWVKNITGKNVDFGSDIQYDGIGNLYVGGKFRDSTLTVGVTSLTNNGNYDVFLAKYDTNGNVIWAKGAGGSTTDELASITIGPYGNIYITGNFMSASITFGGKTLTNSTTGKRDVYVVKYDPNGNVIWAKSGGGTDQDYSNSITTDSLSNAYITGYYLSATATFGAKNISPTGGGYDMFVVKYDSSGTVIWANNYGGSSTDKGNGITYDPAGYIYTTGYFFSDFIQFGTTTLYDSSSAGFGDFHLTKYTLNGTIVWAKGGLGSSLHEEGSEVIIGENSNIYVSGRYSSATFTIGGTTLNNIASGFYNLYIAKFDSSGNPIWAKGTGGSSNDYVHDIAHSSTGKLYLCGSFSSDPLNFGNTNLSNSGSSDLFLAKVADSDVMSLNIAATNESCDGRSDGQMDLTVNGGIFPYNYNWSTGETTEDISKLSAGTYSITVIDAGSCTSYSQTSISFLGVFPTSGFTVNDSTQCSSTNSFDFTNTGSTGSVMGFPLYTYSWTFDSAIADTSIIENPTGISWAIIGNHIATQIICDKTYQTCCDTSTKTMAVGSGGYTVTASSTDNTCFGDNDGIASVSVSGATSPITYNWSSGSTTNSISSLFAGTYTISVLDSSGCVSIENFVITEPDIISIFLSISDAYCGASDGSITSSVTGGNFTYLYNWSTGANTQNIVNLTSGVYVLSVTDFKNCKATATDSVISNMDSCSLVWPGDANSDGVANVQDILTIGLAYGLSGSPRDSISTEWIGQNCQEWDSTFADGLNYKHADCRGDGTVEILDVYAISQNYNLTHSKSSGKRKYNPSNPDLYFEIEDKYKNVAPGALIEVSINLGRDTIALTKAYGLVFTVEYDPSQIDSGSVEMSYDTSWLGSKSDTSLLTIEKDFYNNGKLDVGMVRTDRNSEQGSMQIAKMKFVITDNISGKSTFRDTLQLSFSNVKMIVEDGDTIAVNAIADTTTVVIEDTSDTLGVFIIYSLSNRISLFPNPTASFLNVNYENIEISEFSIYSIIGQQILNQNINPINDGFYIDLKEQQPGFYYITFQTDKGIISKRFLILRSNSDH